MTRNLILAAASMLALSACTVGPRYVSPVPAAPSQTPFLEAGKSPTFSGEQPPGPWWSLFGDPLLDQLIGEALTANTDLRVAAETTRAYADICSFNRQIAVAEDTLRIHQETFDLTRRLFEGGRATRLETGQAGALLEQTRAVVPTLTAQRSAALYRLAVLTGKPPADAPTGIGRSSSGGASLLARRPDIRRAERQLAAAAARVNVATADLYPSISLGGSIGSTASSISGLGKSDGFRFSLGPLISWSFPNMEVARSRLKQAEAGADGALAAFDGAWLTALQESESALANYAGELDRLAALRRAATEAEDAARIARLRYQAGRESFQVVLDTERSLTVIRASIAQSEQTRATNLVALFLALGGGWQDGGA